MRNTENKKSCNPLEGVPTGLDDYALIETVTLSKRHIIYIDDNIESPMAYRNVLNLLRSASEDDVIEVVINSYGGVVDGGVILYEALTECKAKTKVAKVEIAMSAATLPMLACDEFYISPNCQVMFHHYSGSVSGKGSEIKAQQEFYDTYFTDLVKRVYTGVMTDEEIVNLLDGKDYWFNAAEITRRLEGIGKAIL